jgi:hypothetical protein
MNRAMLARKSEAAPAPRAKASSKAAHGGLRVGEPNDAFEREADRVADEVMAGGRTKRDWSFSKVSVEAPLQRKCACGGSGGSAGECEECKEKKTVQRKSAGDVETGYAPLIVQDVLNSPGQPLDAATRAFMEPRFGRDFTNVRVHTDARAAASARAVSATAYSVGRDIVFGTGQYAPGTRRGLELLGHELTHCVQQGAAMPSSSHRLKINDSGDAAENEARVASSSVLRGSSPRPARHTRRQLARQTAPSHKDQPQATASCGPDVTDWFVDVMKDARKNPTALAIQKDLTNAAAGGAHYGYSASDVLEGGLARTVLAAEKAAGNPTRTEAAKSQLAAADPQNQFGKAVAAATAPIPFAGAPAQMMLLLIKRAGERWKSLVQTGAVWDFKNNVLSGANLARAGCPAPCPDPPTLTMCGKCYENNLPGDLLYASVGRFCGFSLNALQLGSQFAELQPDSTGNWDPPGDTADINLGFNLPADLTRGNLCGALAGAAGITVRPCAPCSVSFPSGGAGPSQQAPSPSPPGTGILQRKPISDSSGGSESECEECKKKDEKTLQRMSAGLVPTDEAPDIVHEVLRSPRKPLDSGTRNFFVAQFGYGDLKAARTG